MIRRRPKRWTADEHTTLMLGRADGKSYRTLARMTGHTEQACKIACMRLMGRGGWKQGKIAIGTPTDPEPVTCIDHQRSAMSLARLQSDAELRNRIATMGITAGLMGDPLPSRSALGKKLAEAST